MLDALVLELMERETLDKDEVERIFAPIRKRPIRPIWLSSDKRPVSDRGPVALPPVASNGHGPGDSETEPTTAELGSAPNPVEGD